MSISVPVGSAKPIYLTVALREGVPLFLLMTRAVSLDCELSGSRRRRA
jgi:hypothetical protein